MVLPEERILSKTCLDKVLLQMEKVVGKRWFNLLKDEFIKDYFISLGKIVTKTRNRTTVYPETAGDIFSVFRNTPPETIKCIIIGQDPYPDGSYDGMAFSNNNEKTILSPSLRNIFKEIEDDIYDGFKIDQEPNLKRWQEQGVFLINRVLTVEKNKPKSHSNIGWERFTNRVISTLSDINTPKVFMLWGNDAKSVKKFISGDNNLILETGHPSPLSANRGFWFGNKHFSKTNKFLEEYGIKKIKW